MNCFENTLLDREAMDSLSKIISEKLYGSSVLGERNMFSLLDTCIGQLDIFKLGHVRGQGQTTDITN